MDKNLRNRVSKGSKLAIFDQKSKFLTKNTYKIQTNCPRHIESVLKEFLGNSLFNVRCFQNFFSTEFGCKRPPIFEMIKK